MKIEILGSGGAIRTPRPLCDCDVCQEARIKGVPYSRSSPGVYVHGPDVLIDTSEDIGMQLNRTSLRHIPNVLYSHWHPDHTMGQRIFEANLEVGNWPPHSKMTNVYLPQQVEADFKMRLGRDEHLRFLQDQLRVVAIHTINDGDSITLNDVRITPFRLTEDYVYAFIFEEHKTRILIAMDELYGWHPPDDLGHLDLAILPMGIMEFHPLTGDRLLAEKHPMFQLEATWDETKEMIRAMDVDQAIIIHIEEPFRLSYDDCHTLEDQINKAGFNVRFAFDTMTITI